MHAAHVSICLCVITWLKPSMSCQQLLDMIHACGAIQGGWLSFDLLVFYCALCLKLVTGRWPRGMPAGNVCRKCSGLDPPNHTSH